MKKSISISVIAIILFLGACENSNSSTKATSEIENSNNTYLEKGKQIAAATFINLSSKLQNAMQDGGVSGAIEYCNLAALPLVDSLSKVHQATIRRTSLKVRNPKDRATPQELQQLQFYEKQAKTGLVLKPVVKEIDAQTIAFYAPIHIMPQCQMCHGKIGETLLEDDYKLIKQYYPDDEAIGYSSGDLRGMWSITFKK